MKISKQIARKFVFPTLINLNLEKGFRHFTNNSILNILYHGVVPQNSSYFSPRHISSEQFEKHLLYFIKEFEIISLPKAFELYRNQVKIKRKALTISFDDGYKNNLIFALPILEKYNIKTTFFISGVCAEEMELRALWTDEIACLMYFFKDEIIEIENFRFVNSYDSFAKLSFSDYLKSLAPQNRKRIMSVLITKYKLHEKLKQIPSELWELMNRKDIQTLSESNITDIGSHGYSHFNLGNIGKSEANSEMKKSKELLEGLINKEIDMIAYPDGSYTSEVKDQAEVLGYDKQLAVNYKLNDDVMDKRILNRHGLSSTTTFESNMFFLSKSFLTKGYN
jgi:peptidoglycan/xylan/chitin deacetylase (PgdA/CDA1 family)